MGEPRLIGSILTLLLFLKRFLFQEILALKKSGLFPKLLQVNVCGFKQLSPVKQAWLGQNLKRGTITPCLLHYSPPKAQIYLEAST